MRRMVLVLLFLVMVDEADAFYSQFIFAPMQWVHSVLFMTVGPKVRLFDWLILIALIAASGSRDGKGPRVAPMRSALFVALGTVLLWLVYGIARGGDGRSAGWQVYLLLSGVLFPFAVAATNRTTEHYQQLINTICLAGFYRATMCWIFYLGWVRSLAILPFPDYLTTHDDSVLWVVSILSLVPALVEGTKKRFWNVAGMLFLLGAIQFNQRRLAWVSLAMGLIVAFMLIRPGPAKRRVKRTVLIASPVLILYTVVGWGSDARIFRPLQAFTSVATSESASTKARNVENLGLIATSTANGWLMGTGWGHKYLEVSNKYSIADLFELWQYVPHNSLLGLLAYTGAFGVAGYWLCFPTSMFLNARVALLAATPAERALGLVGATQMVVCANQYYGDMGLFSSKTVYILAASYAMALRVPILTGVWPVAKSKTAAASAAASSSSSSAGASGAYGGGVSDAGRGSSTAPRARA